MLRIREQRNRPAEISVINMNTISRSLHTMDVSKFIQKSQIKDKKLPPLLLLKKEEIGQSPSRDIMSVDEEKRIRRQSAIFILHAGIRLEL